MRLEWAQLAREDRKSILEYIAKESPRAALRTDDAIYDEVLQLIRHPMLGRTGRVPGTRELVIRRTPYVAVYQVRKGAVRVLRVLHGAQQWPLPQ